MLSPSERRKTLNRTVLTTIQLKHCWNVIVQVIYSNHIQYIDPLQLSIILLFSYYLTYIWCQNSKRISYWHPVCRSVNASAIPFAAYGQGLGPIHLDNVFCRGTESRLVDCLHNPWGSHNCGHEEDAGIMCDSEWWAPFLKTFWYDALT